MKVATPEKFHLRGGNQDPGDPGVGKVRGGEDFFSFRQGGGGTDPGWHYEFINNLSVVLHLSSGYNFGLQNFN